MASASSVQDYVARIIQDPNPKQKRFLDVIMRDIVSSGSAQAAKMSSLNYKENYYVYYSRKQGKYIAITRNKGDDGMKAYQQLFNDIAITKDVQAYTLRIIEYTPGSPQEDFLKVESSGVIPSGSAKVITMTPPDYTANYYVYFSTRQGKYIAMTRTHLIHLEDGTYQSDEGMSTYRALLNDMEEGSRYTPMNQHKLGGYHARSIVYDPGSKEELFLQKASGGASTSSMRQAAGRMFLSLPNMYYIYFSRNEHAYVAMCRIQDGDDGEAAYQQLLEDMKTAVTTEGGKQRKYRSNRKSRGNRKSRSNRKSRRHHKTRHH